MGCRLRMVADDDELPTCSHESHTSAMEVSKSSASVDDAESAAKARVRQIDLEEDAVERLIFVSDL